MSFKSLAPGFLIASPPLGDPNFDRTVVLLAIHNEDGALGFVVNRAAPIKLGQLLEKAGYPNGHDDASPVWIGGPVQPQSGWVVIDDPRYAGEGVIEVGARLRITSSRDAFDRIARQAGSKRKTRPPRRMVLLGYSGWGASQLEGEIARGAWLPVPLDGLVGRARIPARRFDERILFELEAAERWEQSYALVGLTPGNVMSMRSIGEA